MEKSSPTHLYLTTAIRAAWQRLKIWFTEDPGFTAQQQGEYIRARRWTHLASHLKAGAAKAGQVVAYWKDSFVTSNPQETLHHLFDQLPGVSSQAARRVVEAELRAPVAQLFSSWEEEPFAAASLGQVHKALGHDGKAYAVKVQYPGIAETLQNDLLEGDTLETLLGGTLGNTPESRQAVVQAILQELDYTQEAFWMQRFGEALSEDEQWQVPEYVPTLSTNHVLTATYLPGSPLLFYITHHPDTHTRNRLTQLLFVYGFGVPLLYGLVNADPNPGNFLVLEGGQRLGLVDFGCCTELSESHQQEERALWQAVLAGDGELLRYTLHRMHLIPEASTFDTTTYRAWEEALVEPFRTSLFQFTPAYARKFLQLTQALTTQQQVTLHPAFVLLWRQRLGVISLLATCGGTGAFASHLWQLLDNLGVAPKTNTQGHPLAPVYSRTPRKIPGW